jgi:hypothetical protein
MIDEISTAFVLFLIIQGIESERNGISEALESSERVGVIDSFDAPCVLCKNKTDGSLRYYIYAKFRELYFMFKVSITIEVL